MTNDRPSRRPGLVAGLAGLIVLAAAAAAVSNALAGPERRLEWVGRTAAAGPSASSSPSATSSSPASAAGAVPAPAASGAHPWKEIGTDEAAALQQSGTLFLDARRTSVYRDGHIAGARSVPVWEAGLDDKVKALFAELPDQTVPIVVYCAGGECEDSHELAQKLYLAGFDGVRVYKDGFPDWEKRKLPIGKGDKP
jgi:rhodanese-related sulfurtransferase